MAVGFDKLLREVYKEAFLNATRNRDMFTAPLCPCCGIVVGSLFWEPGCVCYDCSDQIEAEWQSP